MRNIEDYSRYEVTQGCRETRLSMEIAESIRQQEKALRQQAELDRFMRRFAWENRMELGYDTPETLSSRQ